MADVYLVQWGKLIGVPVLAFVRQDVVPGVPHAQVLLVDEADPVPVALGPNDGPRSQKRAAYLPSLRFTAAAVQSLLRSRGASGVARERWVAAEKVVADNVGNWLCR